MAGAEFELIDRFFKRAAASRASTRLGIGDDCALLQIPAGYELAVTTDTMVESVHFFAGTDPKSLGYKLLAVNLSDLAAMGAEPCAVTLALTLPVVNESWLEAFASGFFELARQYNVDLIGGDTTRGPLTMTVQAFGLVEKQRALLRSAAQIGDVVCMTGLLGEAGLALLALQERTALKSNAALMRLEKPEPRIQEGLSLKNYAHACIDISDGLVADLGHIAHQSGVAALIEWDRLPFSDAVLAYIEQSGDWQMPLQAGDDYELCFTVPPQHLSSLDFSYTQIGVIEAGQGVKVQKGVSILNLARGGYEHFS